MTFVNTERLFASDYTGPDAKVLVDNKLSDIEMDISNDTIYLPIREVADLYHGKIYWGRSTGVILSHDNETYKPDYYINHSKAMVPADYLARVFEFEVNYFEAFNVLAINKETTKPSESDMYQVLPTYKGYSVDDLHWMARIVHAEAKGEPYEAKIAVGSVIINRIASSTYPNSIKEVVFDSKNGVQFTPTINGAIYNNPSTDSWLAALEVLEGKRNAESALFFINPKYAQSSWVSRNREYAFTMKNHDFYY